MNSRFTEFAHGRVEGVRNGAQVQLSFPEDGSVDPLGDERSVEVVHGPAHHAQRHPSARTARNVPHGCDYALEADKQHRRREVDGLVWLVLVRARRLACAEVGELRMWQMQLHEALERQAAVVQTEAAGERVVLGLMAMAREMENRRAGKTAHNIRDTGVAVCKGGRAGHRCSHPY
jgi:hypothetical protein